jgi:acetyl-CoA C-acetyltransferase
MDTESIVIVAAKRTPMGAFQGALKGFTSPQLGAKAIKASLDQISLSPQEVDEVYMGCVLQAGTGQAPARQATILSGLPSSVPASTINKVCGSGMKALMLAYNSLILKQINIAVAGGMESMSNAPYLLSKAREGYRLGHDKIYDHMILDGLQDAYQGLSMGVYADKTAEKYGFSKEDQDAFAIESGTRTLKATKENLFAQEIAPIEIKNKKETILLAQDEPLNRLDFEKLKKLKPAFSENGTVTAGNSSPISDGASALVLMRQEDALKKGLKPLAKIKTIATHAREPEWYTTAPIGVIEKILKTCRWQANDVDLYEINEAFAIVTMAAMKDLKLDHNSVNVHGGACALGHPIGASGARIIITLLYALKARNLKRGIAALCIGGGEATGVAIEVL